MEISARTHPEIPLEVRLAILPGIMLGVSMIILPEDPCIVLQGVSINIPLEAPPIIHPEVLLLIFLGIDPRLSFGYLRIP